MDPATIEAAIELALDLVKAGTTAYDNIKAAQASNDPVALKAQLDALRAANDALMATA